jgi:IS5 family transposase
MGLQVRRGTIHDAIFIEANPGSSRNRATMGLRLVATLDGTWTEKGKNVFRLQTPSKTEIDYGLIRAIETTTAKLHDSQIDISKKRRRCALGRDQLDS